MTKLIKWIYRHPMKSASLVTVVWLVAWYGGIRRPSNHVKIIRQVAEAASERIAFVEQIDYPSGFQALVADQVRIAERNNNYRRQDIVFTEDLEPLAEKPAVDWEGDSLTIYFSRDANVLLERKTLGSVNIKFVRRRELVGARPIGSLLKALDDSTRIWSREDLTAKIWETCRNRERAVSAAEMDGWARLLLIDRPLRTDGTLDQNIQEREVAFLCIGELVEPSLLQKQRPLRQDIGTGSSGLPERFDIKVIGDSDVSAAEDAVRNYVSSGKQ